MAKDPQSGGPASEAGSPKSEALQRVSERSRRMRDQIEASIAKAREQHRRDLFRKRIDLARQGVRLYQNRKLPDAVKAFHTYIGILEDWKQVPEGGLHPGLFNVKDDLPELLLISGVYWDLTKLYDRTKSAEKQREFRHYLEKYLLFTKGMPFQSLAAETMRKYISMQNPRNKKDFKAVYKQLALTQCFVATALYDVSEPETVDRLRIFRDSVLRRSVLGRGFIQIYGWGGPALARFSDRWPEPLRRLAGRLLDGIASCVAQG
jgi:hypothetical protein